MVLGAGGGDCREAGLVKADCLLGNISFGWRGRKNVCVREPTDPKKQDDYYANPDCQRVSPESADK